MKNRELLPKAGAFYKANLHAHTVLSDGHWTPEQIKREYQEKGYSVVAYTDHRHYTWHKDLCDDSFVALAAYEADLNEPFQNPGDFQRVRTYHINFYDTTPETRGDFSALQPPQRYGDVYSLNAFLGEMKERGFLACYNHPWWSLQNYDDYKDLRNVFAMEIYNHGCEHDGLYGYAPQAYDEMLRTGTRLFCVATDDNHNCYSPEHPLCDAFGGFTMLKLPKLSYEAAVEALKQGDFYASTGPEIHSLFIENDTLHLTCSPVQKIYLVTGGRRCVAQVAKPGETVCAAQIPLRGDEGYVRIDCEDANRRHAYSNAYFLDVL